ncbi:hypothetical protein M0G74_12230 [Microbulbifer sp. CAU 1566]|uniref:hypothetical protein n=1 Tax=Microbulbifer sp. CAU 1566 TaxID=2933269 RepID=UPI002002D09C|nr:hypothetical protein [Microbulbifer sp. CAU 1566]MCK7598041.1 hypothetical protein [Microbulbifer sp. CAU 1566]
MKMKKLNIAMALALASAGAQAGGPLYIHEPTMQPYKWDTSKGDIPVYTDGGPMTPIADGGEAQAFTVNYDGNVFLTIEQANAVTAKAIAEWTNVETSTLSMTIQGTIEEQTGIADVNETNVGEIYGKENGYGFWVNYDTDGQILEQYFGVPKNQVLGIAFPEWADEETGEITEATALMNGWFVDISDTEGEKVAGVFTHEFGHAMNMSHSQANGHFSYMAAAYRPYYDGVPGCDTATLFNGAQRPSEDTIETMFPFINVRGEAGRQQSTISVRDDIVNISDLYPTDAYKSEYGSITGKLYLKDGVSEYSGINMVARNIDNPMYDVITQQSGNMTQGMVGPDGTFTINGLQPGARYVLYTDTIKAGGYPTAPTAIVSQAEYWNAGESANPGEDRACNFTPITVQAGETKQTDMYFNGYMDGIQYTPLVQAFVTDLAKNGKKALGTVGNGIPFVYDSVQKSFALHPNTDVRSNGGRMNKNATKAAITADLDGNGIKEPAMWDLVSNKLKPMQDLNGNSCGGSGTAGKQSAAVWDMDDSGEVMVGLGYKDMDGDGNCQRAGAGEMVPVKWDKHGNVEELPYDLPGFVQWVRADRISGDGSVITGSSAWNQVAWVNGEFRDINREFGAQNGTAMNHDGSIVALDTASGVKLWNPKTDEVKEIGGLTWCEDLDYNNFFYGNLCTNPQFGPEYIQNALGPIPVMPTDMNDDGSVIVGRAGSFFTGFVGAVYLEGIGWINTRDFFKKQGVVEASQFPIDNPLSLSANGSEMMGNLAGATITFDIDMDTAFVCKDGRDREVSFPKQLIAEVKGGAEFGRCAHLND